MTSLKILAEFHDVWHGHPVSERHAFHMGLLSVLAEPGDPRIRGSVSRLGAETVVSLIVNPGAHSQLQRAEALGITVDELAQIRKRLPMIDTVFAQAKRHGLTLITAAEDRIPAQFAALGDSAPLVFWAKGDLTLLDALRDGITVEGSRASSPYGEFVAGAIAEDATRAGRTVTTGGGYGIHAAATRAVLAVGASPVIIAASGLGQAYPIGHQELFDTVAERGLLLSEMAVGLMASKKRFQARSRLLAAASAATVIVEAASRSRSLQTAHTARELGRVVAAIPGAVTSAVASGANRLIADGGAQLVQGFADIDALIGTPEKG